jgi:hypothetical protein
MDSRARAALDLHDQLESERSTLNGVYQEIAKRVAPEYASFYRAPTQTDAQYRNTEIFDLTGAVALERFGSALHKMTADSSRIWHTLTVDDEQLADAPDVKGWLDEANRLLFRERYAPESNFATQYLENCKALGAFGWMGTLIEDIPGSPIRYAPLILASTYLTTDAWGRVNGCVRRLEYTAPQLAEKFGYANLPPRVRAAADSPMAGQRHQKWDCVHSIQPGGDRWPVQSVYALRENGTLLAEGGYRELPVAAARFSTMPFEVYGRSPAMLVLPSLKMLNEMKKTFLRAAQKAVDPPLLAHDDGILSVINTAPGKVTTGTVDDQGRPLLIPLSTGAKLDWAQQAMDDERQPVNDVFLVSLFQILADEQRQQTAREVIERAAEKAALLAPATERLQSEYHGPMIRRELAIHIEAGRIPVPPDALAEYFAERGGTALSVRFEGEMARARRADDAGAILRLAETAPAISALDPTAPRRVKWGDAFGKLAEFLGVEQSLIRSDDEMADLEAEDQAMQQAALLAEGVPAAASAAKDFATAEATRAQTVAAQAAPGGALF